MMWLGTVTLAACMFVTPPRGGGDNLPAADPHAFLNRTENCTCCHEAKGQDETVEPHAFIVDIVESCTSCHAEDQLGNSHPVGVRASAQMRIPEELPLDADQQITCGTCHNPHLDGFTTQRYATGQKSGGRRVKDGVEVALYRSFRLRMSVPDAGNDPTCAACHHEYF
jgi:hypothetical protein